MLPRTTTNASPVSILALRKQLSSVAFPRKHTQYDTFDWLVNEVDPGLKVSNIVLSFGQPWVKYLRFTAPSARDDSNGHPQT